MKKQQPIVSIATVLIAATLLANTSAAQFGGTEPEHHLIRIGFGGGATVPTSKTGDVLETGVNGMGFLLIDPGMGIPAIRVNLGYTRFNYKDAVLGGTATGQSNVLSGVGGLSLSLFSIGPIRPYVTAGVGAFNVKDSFAGVASSTSTSAFPASASAYHFGIDGGGGVAFKLGRLEAFAEGRVQNVYTDQGAINAKNIKSIPVTFGIIY